MRRLIAGLVAAGLLGSHFANAECARTIEKPAFEVEELKSELMVTAIACKAQTQYNGFMGRYRGDVAGDEKLIDAYFKRNFGRQGQKQHDDYITNLANVQSQQSTKQGNQFCDERVSMFSEVMALPTAQDLPAYAQGKNLVMPAALEICSVDPGDKATGRRRGGTRHAARRH